nr:hypothetical protein [Tanacetum cinerariifolium]
MDENKFDDVIEVLKQMNLNQQVDLNKQVVKSDNDFESDTEDVLAGAVIEYVS